ncbi:MAG TPA: tRNA 2-thiouridine(34) synthase MnmA, partial [Candidatus Acidoferrum sp.]|nr:tRNA 2-thiouridine(34) synthase MnmA [Candidatus Acidoferrum sp.]
MTAPIGGHGTIAVAMSGGVDSAVAAALLVGQGLPVVGITLRIWPSLRPADPLERFDSCCSPGAVEDARGVAETLGIPHYVLNYEEEFDREVIQDFTDSYLRGQTPNPCVSCNSRLKFGSLLTRARGWGATSVATGHYARVERDPATGRNLLRRAVDARKDQSYFLYGLTQEQLAAARFPVGHLRKEETRRLAREFGLMVSDKPDSQEICFVPRDYRAYLQARV